MPISSTNSVNSGCGILPLMFIAERPSLPNCGRLRLLIPMKMLEELESELDKADVFMR